MGYARRVTRWEGISVDTMVHLLADDVDAHDLEIEKIRNEVRRRLNMVQAQLWGLTLAVIGAALAFGSR